jgi:DnaJ-class molecular chaperone
MTEMQHESNFSFFEESKTCPACDGDGGKYGQRCYVCKGTGEVPDFDNEE